MQFDGVLLRKMGEIGGKKVVKNFHLESIVLPFLSILMNECNIDCIIFGDFSAEFALKI